MKISIVTTLYCSEKYIIEFYERTLNEVLKLTSDYEFVIVNDGSPDNSLNVVLDLVEKDSNVKVIDLSRNFGHHKAIMTGLKHSTGDYIFLVDSDLEEKPEYLMDFYEELIENNELDVVYGVQESRKGGWLERNSGKIFYYIFNRMATDVKNEPNLITMRIMTKRYVSALCEFATKDFYFAPACHMVGFEQKPLIVKKGEDSPTTYNFKLKYHLLINSVFAFSLKPLYFIFYSGLVISIFSFFIAMLLILKKVLYGIEVSGWTSLMISFFLLSGIIIFSVGVLAIYISKIHKEVKNEPFVVVKQVYSKSKVRD